MDWNSQHSFLINYPFGQKSSQNPWERMCWENDKKIISHCSYNYATTEWLVALLRFCYNVSLLLSLSLWIEHKLAIRKGSKANMKLNCN